jgi:uncharacterized protein DUF4157
MVEAAKKITGEKLPLEDQAARQRSFAAPSIATSTSHLNNSLPPDARHFAGNLAMQRLLNAGTIQPKLTVSQPDDPHEHEADHIAEQITASPGASQCSCQEKAGSHGPCPSCQAHSSPLQVQRSARGASAPAMSGDLSPGSSGQPLDLQTRSFMENRFGADLSDVRIHSDTQAASLANRISAEAFTLGRNIVFAANTYRPNTHAGRKLLAHELTHVLQQSGPQRSPASNTISRQANQSLDERVSQFESLVLTTAQDRLTQNQANLRLWRELLDREFTDLELQRQALATAAQSMFLTSVEHSATQVFNEWSRTENPYMRYVQEQQMQGRWRACTGCHESVRARNLGFEEPHWGPAWQSPAARMWRLANQPSGMSDETRARLVQQITANTPAGLAPPTGPTTPGSLSTSTTTTAPATPLRTELPSPLQTMATSMAATGPITATPNLVQPAPPAIMLDPAARIVLLAAQRIGPILEPLGHELRQMVYANIERRHNDYETLKQRIANGRVSYLHLAPILDALLPQADADVRERVQYRRTHRTAWETFVEAFTTIISLLSILFPPLILVAAPLQFYFGYQSFQTGYNYMLGTGANNVFSREQQEMAGGLMATGAFNMGMAAVTFAASARPVADWSATRVAVMSDRAIDAAIRARAAQLQGPVPANEIAALAAQRGLAGRTAHGYLSWRGYQILYRGQGAPTSQIQSPLAREGGVPMSVELYEAMRAQGLSDLEIAGFASRWSGNPVPAGPAPPGLENQPLGGTGIPTTRSPGVASHFARTSPGGQPVVYVLRVPKGTAIDVSSVGWGGRGAGSAPGIQPSQPGVEMEWIIFHEIGGQYVVQTIPASEIPGLVADAPGGVGWSLTVPPGQ